MIQSFYDKETERIFHQQFSRKIPETIQRIALRKLIMINNAKDLNDLRVPPANRLEKLSGGTAIGSIVFESTINTGYTSALIKGISMM